jgi:hypothetical protein
MPASRFFYRSGDRETGSSGDLKTMSRWPDHPMTRFVKKPKHNEVLYADSLGQIHHQGAGGHPGR